MADCAHIWIYDHKTYTTLYMVCKKCGAVRECDQDNARLHPFKANAVARELKIRVDGRDGDV